MNTRSVYRKTRFFLQKWPFSCLFRWSGRQSDCDAPVRACTHGKRIADYAQIQTVTVWYISVYGTSCELLISGLQVRVLPGSPALAALGPENGSSVAARFSSREREEERSPALRRLTNPLCVIGACTRNHFKEPSGESTLGKRM